MTEAACKMEHVALSVVQVGQPTTVVSIEGGRALHDRLRALGIREGTVVVKMSESLGHGPVVVRHGRNQTALGYKICQKIIVAAETISLP